MSLHTAKFTMSCVERDPSTNEEVELAVYQDSKTDRYFAIDASYLIDEEPHIVSTPFGHKVELLDEYE